MNKRLKIETGELLFEKRGHKWALTRFAFEIYGAIQEEITTLYMSTADDYAFSYSIQK